MLDHAALSALNHLLHSAPWARQRLAPFAGRTLRLSSPPLQLALTIDADGYFTATGAEEFDVTIALPAATPLRALEGPESALRDVRIEGSAEFAGEVQELDAGTAALERRLAHLEAGKPN